MKKALKVVVIISVTLIISVILNNLIPDTEEQKTVASEEWKVEAHTIISKIHKDEYTIGYRYFFELDNGVIVEVTKEEFDKFETGDTKILEFFGTEYRELGSE